jgi:guanylate kinase
MEIAPKINLKDSIKMRLEDFDNDEDKIIQDRLKQKTWKIRTNDSYDILKSCNEFVNGTKPWGV